MLKLGEGHSYHDSEQALECSSNGGLFSNFYHALWSLADLHNLGIAPRAITFKAGHRMFRKPTTEDLYPVLFKTDTESIRRWRTMCHQSEAIPRLDHHGVYSLYPFDSFSYVIDAYFEPSESVQQLIGSMREQHRLESEPYVALYYRGTDKGSEVKLPAVADVIEQARQHMDNSGINRCLVQTDDAEVLHRCMTSIPGAFYLAELPVTTGTEGFHFQNHQSAEIDPELFAQSLLAMTHILASADRLVLPCSNLAGWVCLLRRNSTRVVQFNKHGEIVTPTYRALFKIKNRLRWLRSKLTKQSHYYV